MDAGEDGTLVDLDGEADAPFHNDAATPDASMS
jgi:hypothetical protein